MLGITPCLVHIGSNFGDKIDHIHGPAEDKPGRDPRPELKKKGAPRFTQPV